MRVILDREGGRFAGTRPVPARAIPLADPLPGVFGITEPAAPWRCWFFVSYWGAPDREGVHDEETGG
jgi:hypothetical protein